jgi:hypothetical protein
MLGRGQSRRSKSIKMITGRHENKIRPTTTRGDREKEEGHGQLDQK